MNEEQIKQYYERIEKLLNGANKETYGFAPEEIRQILKWYEVLQQENQQLNQLLKDKGFIIDKLMEENRQLKGKINKSLHRIQLLQMDGEVTIRDLGLIVRDLKGENNGNIS